MKRNKVFSAIFLVLLLLCDCYFINILADVGDRAIAECRKNGKASIECQRKLHGVKTRVPADILEYPHMVMIGYDLPGRNDVSYQCGGSLISPLWVLSAAHCIADVRVGHPVRVRLGTTTLEDEEQEEDIIQERKPVDLIVHPEYKPPAKYNDIALIKMEGPIDLNGEIKIACLNVAMNQDIVRAKASGFGKTKFDDTDGSLTMMHVDLDIIPSEQCNKSLKSMIRRGGALKQGIKQTQICAGDLIKGGKDTCQGDSGGPLQFLPQNPDCINTFPLFVILGVTSFGRFCGFRNSPGVYTRVSQYIDWIENIVWPEDEQTTTEQYSAYSLKENYDMVTNGDFFGNKQIGELYNNNDEMMFYTKTFTNRKNQDKNVSNIETDDIVGTSDRNINTDLANSMSIPTSSPKNLLLSTDKIATNTKSEKNSNDGKNTLATVEEKENAIDGKESTEPLNTNDPTSQTIAENVIDIDWEKLGLDTTTEAIRVTVTRPSKKVESNSGKKINKKKTWVAKWLKPRKSDSSKSK